MKRLTGAGIYLILVATAALSLYELTAKSPTWLGAPLPGWQQSRQIEFTTGWNQPTGILPVDKLLHESEEAVSFYALLARGGYSRSRSQPR